MRKIPPVEIEFRIVLARAAPADWGEAPCPASAAASPLARLTAWLVRISDRFAAARPRPRRGVISLALVETWTVSYPITRIPPARTSST